MSAHYTAIVFLSAMTMVIMTCAVQSNIFLETGRKRAFQFLFLVLMITNLAEWTGEFLNGSGPEWRIVHICAKLAEYSLSPMIPALAMRALNIRKTKMKWEWVPVTVNWGFLAVSLFTGIIFSVNAENVRIHGPLYPEYMIAYALEILLLLVYCIRFARRYQSASNLFLLGIFALILAATALQFFPVDLRLDWSIISICSILFYIFYVQLVQQVDSLTSLLNRKSFDCAVERADRPVTVVFFDVDHFKRINDTYGHAFGDEALTVVSQAMKQTFERFGACYRIGGDEFCAVLHVGPERVEKLISAFIARLSKIRETEPRAPFVSMGYTCFDPHSEAFPDAVKRADEMMYRYKEQHRS